MAETALAVSMHCRDCVHFEGYCVLAEDDGGSSPVTVEVDQKPFIVCDKFTTSERARGTKKVLAVSAPCQRCRELKQDGCSRIFEDERNPLTVKRESKRPVVVCSAWSNRRALQGAWTYGKHEKKSSKKSWWL
jgi:hypothetical protein